MKIALLCSGLGHIARGHEAFARGLFDLLQGTVDITLFKGGGAAHARELVVPHVPRYSDHLSSIQLPVSPKWQKAAVEVERMRVEGETFAWGALAALLAGDYDIIHCLEQEVCNVLYSQRHLFRRTPKILWSNGGAIAAADIPQCDFVQEHSAYNLARSARHKAFVIPHGVDMRRFHPGVVSDFRQRHGIPQDAFVVISVGTICYWHKRTDHVIREVATVPGAWLLLVGQEGPDSAAIKALGAELMDGRVVCVTLPHEDLPQAYAAADVFTLGSLFETFGIVYIEAMAMGLPVVCTGHPNQREIVEDGVFVDMARPGALGAALLNLSPAMRSDLAQRGPERVRQNYDLTSLLQQYLVHYTRIAATTAELPRYTLKHKLSANVDATWRQVRSLLNTARD